MQTALIRPAQPWATGRVLIKLEDAALTAAEALGTAERGSGTRFDNKIGRKNVGSESAGRQMTFLCHD
jgi:hypothetical protein